MVWSQCRLNCDLCHQNSNTALIYFEEKVKTTTTVAIAIAAIASALLAVLIWPEGEDLAAASAPIVPQTATTAVVGSPVAAVDVILPSFDVVRISREGTGVIAGRAAPDAFVEVKVGDQIIGRVRANQAGEWVLIFDAPLEVGPQELSLVAHSTGMDPVQSDNIVVLAVPVRNDGSTITTENGVIAVLTSRYGGGVSRVLQKPGSYIGASILEVSTLDFDERGKAIFSGVADSGVDIRIYLDNEFIGTVSVEASGQWVFSPDNMIYAGGHVLRLDQMREGDIVELRVEQPFDTTDAMDMVMAESSVVIMPGNNLWHIARRVYGSGILYTQIFRANNEAIRDPNLIFPGQKFILPRAEISLNRDI